MCGRGGGRAPQPTRVRLHARLPQNKTNGVTPRRWLNQCNRGLTALISKWTETEASVWLKDMARLEGLRAVSDHPTLQAEWQAVKNTNKARLAAHIQRACKVTVHTHALFDVQAREARLVRCCLYS